MTLLFAIRSASFCFIRYHSINQHLYDYATLSTIRYCRVLPFLLHKGSLVAVK